MAHHAMDRYRQGNPRGGQREARGGTFRDRCRAHLCGDVRYGHRVPRHRCLSAAPDLLCQPSCRRRLRAHCLHHRRARWHGFGGGRVDRRAVHRRGREPVGLLSRGVAGPNRYFRDVHPRPVASAQRSVRSADMKGLVPIVGAVALLGTVPLITSSNVVLNFLVLVFLIALVGQGWNLLGGYGGQYSFGHAAFFGTGAYVTAVLQVRYGVNAWLGFGIGIVAGGVVGAAIGALSFRAGLKGSYFALVTLAFAEVLRIIASVAPITGAGVGTLITLDLRPEALQFQSRAPFYWIILGLVGVSLILIRAIEDSRFGAYLIAVRENEDAAEALGVDTTAVKLGAMTISAAITAAGGCFYAQYFLFIDASIAYGPWISVEALLAPIIGGTGTVFGPLLGALVVKTLGELTKLVTGSAPGLDLVIYGCVLVAVVAFAPGGIAGLLSTIRARARRFVPERRHLKVMIWWMAILVVSGELLALALREIGFY